MSWSSEQYSKFEKQRNRPIMDLLANIPNPSVHTAMDLGCGPGNSTELLLDRFPEAEVAGMDSSADMIEAARKRLPGIDFQVGDISGWQPTEKYDIVLANAALQWVPDHEKLFPTLLKHLKPGGTLAVQMPDNFEEPSHRAMRDIASRNEWTGRLAEVVPRVSRPGAAWYYELLEKKAAVVDVWRTIYHHPLIGGLDAIVEWFKGSGLTPYLALLDEEEQQAFLAQYRDEIAKSYRVNEEGGVLLPFPRLFLVATVGLK